MNLKIKIRQQAICIFKISLYTDKGGQKINSSKEIVYKQSNAHLIWGSWVMFSYVVSAVTCVRRHVMSAFFGKIVTLCPPSRNLCLDFDKIVTLCQPPQNVRLFRYVMSGAPKCPPFWKIFTLCAPLQNVGEVFSFCGQNKRKTII